MKKLTDLEIYRAFLEAKEAGKVSELPKKLGITHWRLYNVIDRVKNGDKVKIRRCTTLGRLECLWQFKYKTRYLALPKNRKASTVTELREIIREMKADEFPQATIGRLMKKDRSTIIHHLQSV